MARKRRVGPGAPPLQRDVAAMRALAHPIRMRIFELLANSPKSVTEIAQALGQPRNRLYHHVNGLERAGLLRLSETRKVQGNIEKSYEAVLGAPAVAKTGRVSAKARVAKKSAERALATAALDQLREDVLKALSETSSPLLPLIVRFKLTAAQSRTAEMRSRLLELFNAFKTDFGIEDGSVDDPSSWIVSVAIVPTAKT